MSQHSQPSDEKKSENATKVPLEKITIDSSEKYDAYSRFQSGIHKLSQDLALINNLINKANTQLFIITRLKEIFTVKHNILSEYGKAVYDHQPTLIYLTPITVDPLVNIPNIDKYYFDPSTGFIRIEGEESSLTQPTTPSIDEEDEDLYLSSVTESQLLASSKRNSPASVKTLTKKARYS